LKPSFENIIFFSCSRDSELERWMGCVVQTGGAGAGVWEEHHDRSAWQFVACYYRVLGQAHTEEGHQAGALHGHPHSQGH
jgi:hypothetical protein